MVIRQLGIFLILNIVIFMALSSFFKSKVNQQIQTDQELISISFDAAISYEQTSADTFFNLSVNTPPIQKIMADVIEADKQTQNQLREQLYSLLVDEYNYRIKTENLKQLHFHTPKNRSFLRFHRPSLFGDDLSNVRETVATVNRNKQPVTSFEEGRIFNGYRFVYPIFYRSKHVGSVETSVSIKALMSIFTTHLQAPTSFLLKRSLVEEKVFSTEQGNYKLSNISENYVIERSVQKEVEQLTLDVHDSGHMSHKEHEERMARGEFFSDFAHTNGSLIINHYFPIYNTLTNNHSGYFIIARDHAILSALFNQLLTVFLVLSALIAFWIALYNHVVKTRTELDYQTEVLDEVQSISNIGTWKLEYKTGDLFWSKQTYEIMGVDAAFHPNIDLLYKLVHPEDLAHLQSDYQNAIDKKQGFTISHRIVQPSGQIKYVSQHAHLILNRNNEIEYIVGITKDNSEHTEIINQLNKFINTQKELITLISDKGLEFTNQALLDFLKVDDTNALYSRYSSLNQYFLDLEGFFTSSAKTNLSWIKEIEALPQKERIVLMNDPQGIRHAFSVTVSPLDTDKSIVAFHDITETITEVQRLTDKVQHDKLTRAHNREYLESLMMQIAVSQREAQYYMILFDIDHFKTLNDTHGHLKGDQVLQQLTELTKSTIRDSDTLVRWGGEEFILIGESNTLEISIKLAEKIRHAIEIHNFNIGTHNVTCSFGVTLFNNQERLEDVIKRADELLYQAKESGRNCVKASPE